MNKLLVLFVLATAAAFAQAQQNDVLERALNSATDACLLAMWEEKLFVYGEDLGIKVGDQDIVKILKILSGPGAEERAKMRMLKELASHSGVQEGDVLFAAQETEAECVAQREALKASR